MTTSDRAPDPALFGLPGAWDLFGGRPPGVPATLPSAAPGSAPTASAPPPPAQPGSAPTASAPPPPAQPGAAPAAAPAAPGAVPPPIPGSAAPGAIPPAAPREPVLFPADAASGAGGLEAALGAALAMPLPSGPPATVPSAPPTEAFCPQTAPVPAAWPVGTEQTLAFWPDSAALGGAPGVPSPDLVPAAPEPGWPPAGQALTAPAATAPATTAPVPAALAGAWVQAPVGDPLALPSGWTSPYVPAMASAWPGQAALGLPDVPGDPLPAVDPVLVPASEAEARPPSLPPAPAAPGAVRAGRPEARVGQLPVETIRADFPILSERVEGGQKLVWLDNAATTQKPQAVIDRLVRYYRHENSNVHRAAHELASRAEEAYEGARRTVARFIGAPDPANIVFVRGTTEGVNLVAQAFAKPRLSSGDEIVLTVLEHHANIVPWQQVAAETGARLVVAPVDEDGQIDLGGFAKALTKRTKIAAVAHVSNALGTVTPLAEMTALAHARGVPIVVDGAQSVSHLPVNVAALGVDFFIFSGHKIYGPTGIGAVYGTTEALEEARPWQGGGNMIVDVTFERTVYQGPPQKFEAGTPNIAGAAGLAAALDYVTSIGLSDIAAYEQALLAYGTSLLSEVRGLRFVGTAAHKASVLSFVLEGHDNRSVGARLSRAGIAVRAGHHCAQPIHRRFGLEGSVRPSIAFYNTAEELEYLASVLHSLAG